MIVGRENKNKGAYRPVDMRRPVIDLGDGNYLSVAPTGSNEGFDGGATIFEENNLAETFRPVKERAKGPRDL